MENYCKDVLKVVVAQICSTMGWHRIQTTPMEVMVDILSRYLRQMATRTNRYAEHCKFLIYIEHLNHRLDAQIHHQQIGYTFRLNDQLLHISRIIMNKRKMHLGLLLDTLS